uniref:non-specific serine/threonine protein kinase n=1 Tax=Angiostrongylus cantonensis TaxID=6313 RepID=A0A0K0D3E0_ANGCA
MMVARVKEHSRINRSEPSICPSNKNKEDTFARSASAQTISVCDHLEEGPQMSVYWRTLHMLATDPIYQKEVALGKRIGFYRLGKELGAGNFSKVKLGIHVLTKEKVAVKIMDRTKMDAKAQRLLDREIKSMEHMNHPNIIRLFECVETLTRTHLVVEYAGGGELYAFVHERGKLTDADAKPLFAQIVAAVSHMVRIFSNFRRF